MNLIVYFNAPLKLKINRIFLAKINLVEKEDLIISIAFYFLLLFVIILLIGLFIITKKYQ